MIRLSPHRVHPVIGWWELIELATDMPFHLLPFRRGACGLVRLLVALALVLVPWAGSHAAMAGPAPAALQVHADAPEAGHHHSHLGAGHDGQTHAAQTPAKAPAPAPHDTHKACGTASCPICLWQAAMEPALPVPALNAALPSPAQPPAPLGHVPAPALDPPRLAA